MKLSVRVAVRAGISFAFEVLCGEAVPGLSAALSIRVAEFRVEEQAQEQMIKKEHTVKKRIKAIFKLNDNKYSAIAPVTHPS
ncbi:hypothetical protein OI18_11695 [Flavihumibacter solisilvae]|uniref:Uncharacterized protein n=1 Tax=Flavihumibacter solisilvae TaxID=1349421 RepID=A0A0C1LG15_9BACT|nr:hypothetical protein OI18_11695 [Flavihumibacter solisilvae]